MLEILPEQASTIRAKAMRAKAQFEREGFYDVPPPGPVGFSHDFYTDHKFVCTSCVSHQQALQQARRGGVMRIGNNKQLLADDVIISSSCGISREIGHPEKLGVVLERDRSWESSYFGFYGRCDNPNLLQEHSLIR